MTTTARTIEVRHEGGLVYCDGLGMTASEADSLARLLQAAASDARGWRHHLDRMEARAAEIARLEASGLTHITAGGHYYGGAESRYARRDGLPVVVNGLGETPAHRPIQVGPGPALEARVYGGRKWRPVAELSAHQHVSAWRVVPS
jgi:hypothetical protein